MKRDYTEGKAENIVFFTGVEVEHTPAHGMDTLFVTGVQPITDIAMKLTMCGVAIKHIFFGANHSFNFDTTDIESWESWENMIIDFLKKGYLCSLDIPLHLVEEFNDNGLNEFDNFIPQIRVPIPYIKLWNYNTMIKIDDKDFKATNPGVWSHSLHDLKDRSKFTSWDQYSNDKIIK
jgi:hypothetical protein